MASDSRPELATRNIGLLIEAPAPVETPVNKRGLGLQHRGARTQQEFVLGNRGLREDVHALLDKLRNPQIVEKPIPHYGGNAPSKHTQPQPPQHHQSPVLTAILFFVALLFLIALTSLGCLCVRRRMKAKAKKANQLNRQQVREEEYESNVDLEEAPIKGDDMNGRY